LANRHRKLYKSADFPQHVGKSDTAQFRHFRGECQENRRQQVQYLSGLGENEMGYDSIAEMLGKTLVRIDGGERGSEHMTLFASDGTDCALYHSPDCCESVEVEEIVGDLGDLIGSPLLIAEEVTSENEPLEGCTPDYAESYTWTFYKLATVRGHVTLRWLGSSNGYYSERVNVSIRRRPEQAVA
jgi:hypothetical protein